MAANPQFAASPQYRLVSLSNIGAASRTSSTTNCVQLITGSSSTTSVGTKVTQIGGKYQAQNAAGTVFIYITNTTGASSSALLYDELLFTATTPSTTAVSARVINTYTDLQLMPGQAIFVGSSIQLTSTQSVTIWASGGDL